jgi:uncharacterized protein (TIGR00297 family)
MSRRLNYLAQFAFVLLFVLASEPDTQIRSALAILLSASAAYLAFQLKLLSLDGFWSATIVGSIAAGFGGWWMALALVVFFLSSSMIGMRAERSPAQQLESFGRDGLQVWSNSGWLIIMICGFMMWEQTAWILAGLASVAAANADTWATEWASRNLKRKTWLITSFSRVAPGTDGGVSIGGTLASLVGSAVIALFSFLIIPEAGIDVFLIILIAGFAGSIVDSIIGALFQYGVLRRKITLFKEIRLSNNNVNVAGTGFSALAVFILILSS